MNLKRLRYKFVPAAARSEMAGRRAYIGISLSEESSGQDAISHRLLQWAIANKLETCFVIGDYFFRRNLQDFGSMPPAQALSHATSMGLAVAQMTRVVATALDLQPPIYLASELCVGSDFYSRVQSLFILLQTNPRFAYLVDSGANRFIARNSESRANVVQATDHSRMYQIEEIAMFEMLARKGWLINAYWGTHLPVMNELVAGELRGICPDLNGLTLVELSARG